MGEKPCDNESNTHNGGVQVKSVQACISSKFIMLDSRNYIEHIVVLQGILYRKWNLLLYQGQGRCGYNNNTTIDESHNCAVLCKWLALQVQYFRTV